MYLISFKSEAPDLLDSYWQRNGGKQGREDARKYGKKKQARQHTSSSKQHKQSKTPSTQRYPFIDIISSSSSSSNNSSKHVTPEIPSSKRSLSPSTTTKDSQHKRIRHDDSHDNQVPILSSPVQVARQPAAVEKEARQPVVERAEEIASQTIDLSEDEELQQPIAEAISEEESESLYVEATPEQEPQPSSVEATIEEEPQQALDSLSPAEEPQQPTAQVSPEESHKTTVAAIPEENEEDTMLDDNVEKDELMEELPAQDVEMTKERSPTPHIPATTTTDTDILDDIFMSDNEADRPTTTSSTTIEPVRSSPSSSRSKLSQSDIRTLVKDKRSTPSWTMDDSTPTVDKLSSNKENIAFVSDTTPDIEDHTMPGTPKDKQLKEINVDDIIWDPEYPPSPCNWSQEAECVETVVADPNNKNTFHAIVRW